MLLGALWVSTIHFHGSVIGQQCLHVPFPNLHGHILVITVLGKYYTGQVRWLSTRRCIQIGQEMLNLSRSLV